MNVLLEKLFACLAHQPELHSHGARTIAALDASSISARTLGEFSGKLRLLVLFVEPSLVPQFVQLCLAALKTIPVDMSSIKIFTDFIAGGAVTERDVFEHVAQSVQKRGVFDVRLRDRLLEILPSMKEAIDRLSLEYLDLTPFLEKSLKAGCVNEISQREAILKAAKRLLPRLEGQTLERLLSLLLVVEGNCLTKMNPSAFRGTLRVMMEALVTGEKQECWYLADWAMWMIQEFSTSEEQKEPLLDELAEAMWSAFTRKGWISVPFDKTKAEKMLMHEGEEYLGAVNVTAHRFSVRIWWLIERELSKLCNVNHGSCNLQQRQLPIDTLKAPFMFHWKEAVLQLALCAEDCLPSLAIDSLSEPEDKHLLALVQLQPERKTQLAASWLSGPESENLLEVCHKLDRNWAQFWLLSAVTAKERWQDSSIFQCGRALCLSPPLCPVPRCKPLFDELIKRQPSFRTAFLVEAREFLDEVLDVTMLFYHQTVADVSKLSPVGIRGGLPWEVGERIAEFVVGNEEYLRSTTKEERANNLAMFKCSSRFLRCDMC